MRQQRHEAVQALVRVPQVDLRLTPRARRYAGLGHAGEHQARALVALEAVGPAARRVVEVAVGAVATVEAAKRTYPALMSPFTMARAAWRFSLGVYK